MQHCHQHAKKTVQLLVARESTETTGHAVQKAWRMSDDTHKSDSRNDAATAKQQHCSGAEEGQGWVGRLGTGLWW